MHKLFGYIDVFPQHEALSGRKCLILGEFQKYYNFSMLNNRCVDCVIKSLTSNGEMTHRGMIMDFGVWVYRHSKAYGVILPEDTILEKGCIVSVEITVPNLGGF